jgi:hypothetical protein
MAILQENVLRAFPVTPLWARLNPFYTCISKLRLLIIQFQSIVLQKSAILQTTFFWLLHDLYIMYDTCQVEIIEIRLQYHYKYMIWQNFRVGLAWGTLYPEMVIVASSLDNCTGTTRYNTGIGTSRNSHSTRFYYQNAQLAITYPILLKFSLGLSFRQSCYHLAPP